MKKNLLMLFLALFCCSNFLFAQIKQITGKVSSADDNTPIPGVSVKIKGTTKGATVTNEQGVYTIAAQEGQTLVFSFIGLITQEKIVGASGTIDVQLKQNAQALSEVIVTGFGTGSVLTGGGVAI